MTASLVKSSWILGYRVVFLLALPVLLGRLLFLSGWNGGAFWQYLGFVPRMKGHVIWIHAASVGEVMVAKPLINKLKSRYPYFTILLTTTTQTGAEQARSLGSAVMHCFAPLDCPSMVARFLDRTRPKALLIIETERWLNYSLACQQRGIPMVVVNARLSPRSFRRYRWFPVLFRLWAEPLTKLLVQHKDDAQRFTALGVAAEKQVIAGSIKFDLAYPSSVYESGKALRANWGERPVWIAASTHKGEDELVLQAFRQVLVSVPNALLILVPRHPQRFEAVAALCGENGFSVARRSRGEVVTSATAIYLGDTMGELPILFAAVDVAFVGGSLVAVGGHNLLEPAALGKPCVTGKHHFNFADVTRQLVASCGAQVVQDAATLATVVTDLLSHPQQCRQMGEAARQVVEANRGALQKTLQALVGILP